MDKKESAEKFINYCFKCRDMFETEHELETDKPTCNKCFDVLLKINTAEDYYKFIDKS